MVCTVRFLAGPRLVAARRWVAIGCLLLLPLVYQGIRIFDNFWLPYCDGSVIAFDEIEDLITERLPAGALVIGNEPAFLAARRAGAEFVFDESQLQWRYRLTRVPGPKCRVEASHVVEYKLDLSLLEEIAGRGTPVYYLVDMRDWSWNAYYPNGRYAASFASLSQMLDQWFVPVLRIYTRDRGFVSLHKSCPGGVEFPKRRSKGRFTSTPRFHLGGEIHSTTPPIVPALVAFLGRPLATFPSEPGRWYWVSVDLSMPTGNYAAALWNGLPGLAMWMRKSRCRSTSWPRPSNRKQRCPCFPIRSPRRLESNAYACGNYCPLRR